MLASHGSRLAADTSIPVPVVTSRNMRPTVMVDAGHRRNAGSAHRPGTNGQPACGAANTGRWSTIPEQNAQAAVRCPHQRCFGAAS